MPSYSGVGHRPRSVERFLLSGERCVVAVRRHWIVIAEPWLTALGSLLLVAWLTFDVADPRLGRPLDLMWWLWFALLGRAVWLTSDHTRTWFVATDRRLLMVYGFFIRKVAMMPLTKVTDMSYHRSPLGWVLGYGTFVLESAGQDQALHKIDHVPHPDPTYRAIISEIFRKDVDEEVPNIDEDGEYSRDDDGSPVTEEWDDDPTNRLAMSEDKARGWGELLRIIGERAGGGGGRRRSRRGRETTAPEPDIGTSRRANLQEDEDDRCERSHDRVGREDRNGRASAGRLDNEGEWVYRSDPEAEASPASPSRDPMGFWD